MTQVVTTEKRRGCGYRKHQGMYLVCDAGISIHCDLMPYLLKECECCGMQVNQTRDLQWVRVSYFQHDSESVCKNTSCPAYLQCGFTSRQIKSCPQCDGGWETVSREDEEGEITESVQVCSRCKGKGQLPNKVAVMWVGSKYYPTPADFMKEVDEQGVSKRLPVHKIPEELELGSTWVMLGHPKAIKCQTCNGEGSYDKGEADVPDTCFNCDGKGYLPGLFYAFQPTRLEVLLKDEDLVEKCPDCDGAGGMDGDPDHELSCDTCEGLGTIPSKWAKKVKDHDMTVVRVTDDQMEDEKEVRAAEREAKKLAKRGLLKCETCNGSGMVGDPSTFETICVNCNGEGTVSLDTQESLF